MAQKFFFSFVFGSLCHSESNLAFELILFNTASPVHLICSDPDKEELILEDMLEGVLILNLVDLTRSELFGGSCDLYHIKTKSSCEHKTESTMWRNICLLHNLGISHYKEIQEL